jgi:6-phosphogluconolactonase
MFNMDVLAGIGPDLHRWKLAPDCSGLTLTGRLPQPARIQYAWPHGRLPVLYVACADRGPGPAGRYFLCPVLSGPDGLVPLQNPVRLPHRPIHLTVDPDGTHLLVVYPEPSGLTVHPLRADGTLAGEPSVPELDLGVYAHQVRFSPNGRWLIVPSRGPAAEHGRPAVSGCLNVLSYRDGAVTPAQVLDLGGRGEIGSFNPRHVDFHPVAPLLFVILERQNQLVTLRWGDHGIDAEPRGVSPVLEPGPVAPRQLTAEVRVHPSGRHVYVSTRADSAAGGGERGPGWVTPEVLPVFGGGSNSITVFDVDPRSGRTTPVRHVGTEGIYPRTFCLDPAGELLLVGNAKPMQVRDGAGIVTVPASLVLFAATESGLSRLRRFSVDVGRETMEWSGLL